MTLATTAFQIVRRTANALQVRVDGREVWLPNSQVRWTADGLWLPTWLAKARGLASSPSRATGDWPSCRG